VLFVASLLAVRKQVHRRHSHKLSYSLFVGGHHELPRVLVRNPSLSAELIQGWIALYTHAALKASRGVVPAHECIQACLYMYISI